MTVALITTRRFSDDRGWFSETYSARRCSELGIAPTFVQDNQSLSLHRGTLRGLHFQRPPHAQAKLVRCLRGRIYDVAVDVRRGSPTFGHWVGAELSAESGDQLFIPIGFAHGFVTLESDTEVGYKASDFYAPESEGGIRWDDPTVGVTWPVDAAEVIVSEKDRALSGLAAVDNAFSYDGTPIKLVGHR
jgi:dTDP-4-dehydrorhamnose 3,5-epimerase